MKNKRTLGCIVLILCAVIWGGGITVQSVLGQSLGAFTVITIKAAGGFLLIPAALFLKQCFTKQTIIYGVICGLIMLAADVTQQIGIETSSVGKASFITALYMLFVPVMGFLFFRKQTKPTVWFCVILAAIGFYLLCLKLIFYFHSIVALPMFFYLHLR